MATTLAQSITDRLAATDMDIEMLNGSLVQALATLTNRADQVATAVNFAHGIMDPGLLEAATRVEALVIKRTAAYEKRVTLVMLQAQAS